MNKEDKRIKKSCIYYREDKGLKGFLFPYCNHKSSILTKNSNCNDCVHYQSKTIGEQI